MGLFGGASRLTGAGYGARVGQWLQRSQVKSIQRGTITLTTPALTNTATITAVVTNAARLRLLGVSSNNAGGSPSTDTLHLVLTNSTTITATRTVDAGDSPIVSYEIIEYWPGVIRSVQRATISVTGAATNTATITSVNTAKTELDYLGCQMDANLDTLLLRLALTNATTVTATRSSGAANVSVVSFQAVEWW